MGKALELAEAEREAIARGLFEVHGDRQGDELHGLCPFHGETNPSFSYNIVKDVYNCFTCQVHGDLIRLWSKTRGAGNTTDDFKEFCSRHGIRTRSDERDKNAGAGGKTPADGAKSSAKAHRITITQLAEAWSAMPSLPESWRERLGRERGWSGEAIEKLDLRLQTRRWDKAAGRLIAIDRADRVAIPVFDSDGVLGNIRCYKPGAKRMKIFSFAPGTGKARLFPARPMTSDQVVLVVEGESDVICAVSQGFDAITQTSKTKYWPAEQAQVLSGRDVVIAYDADQPGQKYARHAGDSLVKVAGSVRLLEWPAWMGRDKDGTWPKDHGQDLTDFFVRHDKSPADLQALIDAAETVTADAAKNACATDFFDMGPGGRVSFKPRLLADRICAEVEILCDPDSGLVHKWNGAYFERYADDYIERRCIELLGDEAQQSRVRDAAFQAKRLSSLPHGRTLNDRENWVCLKNGMLNLRSLELVAHKKDFFSSYQLPVTFDPDGKGRCDRFLTFLEETVQTPGPIAQVQEFAGYCLTREVRYEKALLLLGPGADGKSTLLSILEALVGSENCSATSFNDLDNEFHRSSLYGKVLNISTEIGNRAIESAYFKAITSGDAISAAYKHMNAFHFRPHCKLAFAGNRLPRILDNSDGVFRKLLPVLFKRQFLEDGDPLLKEKLIAELSDIFHWALVGLHRLWSQNGFTDDDETRALLMEHRRANNPVLCFVEDECMVGQNYETAKSDIYRRYKRYADGSGYSIMGKENFFRELQAAVTNLRQYRPRVGGVPTRTLVGIALIPDGGDPG
ncbi:MAG: toprim domain-containing protein [Deltaproteobacteria bacterium]|nr:toprim domain-containing protein [Deltaproteobacteria bacterium]